MTGTRPSGGPTAGPDASRGTGLAVLDAFAAATTMLAGVLLERPTAEQLARLASLSLVDEWPLPDAPGAQTVDARDLAAALQDVSEAARAGDVEPLLHDHMALFDAPGHSTANPYESVRRDDEHLMFGPHTLAVRQAYGRFGVAAPDPRSVADDHLGLELAFVSHLLVRALDAAEAGDDDGHDAALGACADFVQGHVARFGRDVAADMREHAATPYFRGWAVLLDDLIARLDAVFTA